VGDIVAVVETAVLGQAEIEFGGRDDEAFAPGKAGEINAKFLADNAATAVGADKIAAAMRFDTAIGRLHGQGDAIRTLFDTGHFVGAEQGEVGEAVRMGIGDVDNLVLFDLERKRVLGMIRNQPVIEFGDDPVVIAVAKLEDRGNQPLGDQFLGHAERFEHVERRRVYRRGSVVGRRYRRRIEHRYRHVVARQVIPGDHAHRPGAGDQDTVLLAHLSVLCRIFCLRRAYRPLSAAASTR